MKQLGRVEKVGHSLTLLDGGYHRRKKMEGLTGKKDIEIHKHRVVFLENEHAQLFLDEAKVITHLLSVIYFFTGVGIF